MRDPSLSSFSLLYLGCGVMLTATTLAEMQKNTARVKAAKEAVRIGKERYAKFEGQACKEEENFNAHAGEEKSENAAVTEGLFHLSSHRFAILTATRRRPK